MSMTTFSARGRVAIAGCAQSRIARYAPMSLGALTLQTCLAAIADAGLKPSQIDGFTTGALFPSSGSHAVVDGTSIVSANWVAEQLGIHPRWACGFQGHGQIPGAVILAVNAIASGAADYVLLHRALHNPRTGRYHQSDMAQAAGAAQWSAPHGWWGPPAQIALPYMEYLQRYGATREAMATVVTQIRRNVQSIPAAYWYGKPLTRDQYLAGRMIADPISVLDCDIPVDGAAAFVLTSAERARDLPHRPVYVAGYAQGHPVRSSQTWRLDDLIEGGQAMAERLWQASGVSRHEVDVPQIYDGFSPFVYFWLEALGYCPRGEAHRFVQDGTIDIDGPFPLLSGGGSLGNGRMHGVPHMLECYLQLSRRAGERQLRRASVGLACHSFPNAGGAVVYTAEPT